jgi:signal transduction histidine kinase
MLARLGLQARMTLSYVFVTAAAVLLVEGLASAFVVPGLLSAADLEQHVQVTAVDLAIAAYNANQDPSGSRLTLPAKFTYGIGTGSELVPAGTVRLQGSEVVIPRLIGTQDVPRTSIAVITDPAGTVLASSVPDTVVSGTALPKAARAYMPTPAIKALLASGLSSGTISGKLVWATAPVQAPKDVVAQKVGATLKTGKPPAGPTALGTVYVQVPDAAPGVFNFEALRPLLQAGLILLAVSLPVGVLFGYLTTRGPVRRLGRLAASTARIGDGNLELVVTPGPPDEVGRLERQFNTMAARLDEARESERRLAEEAARTAERTRIARELHDAVSQDLFSLALLAGGLERALPDGSPLREKATEMRQVVSETVQEMTALLLELRPSLLEERGLLSALDELCGAYRSRVGVTVSADLEQVSLAAPAEHAVFRAAQEGMSNAVRHAAARSISVSLRQDGDRAELRVADDGRGFDTSDGWPGIGLGLRLMRERMAELGGTLVVTSVPGGGTCLAVTLPAST